VRIDRSLAREQVIYFKEVDPLGWRPMSASPTQFSKSIADDFEKWSKVIKFAGIKRE
jgi:tripartite-type tricarboxylate transporter receptor subunit TctC